MNRNSSSSQSLGRAAASASENPNLIASVIGFVLIAVILYATLSVIARPSSDAPATMARQVVTRAANTTTTFQVNRNAALYRRAQELGWGEPTTDEIHFTVGGTAYVAQGFKNGILFTASGHWSRNEIQTLSW